MSPLRFQCTVCTKKFVGRERWHSHLLTEFHQAKARVNCTQWSKEERECVLVTFFTVPLTPTKVSNLLSRFGVSDMGGLVTDFVWWPERPKVALLEFENRKQIDEILIESGGQCPVEVCLEDCAVYLKKAGDYYDIEWNELILCSAIQASSSPSVTPTLQPKLTVVGSPPCTSAISSSSLHKLFDQFRKLVSFIEIPPVEYNMALEIMQKIENVFGPEYYTVSMYGTWFLKLRSLERDVPALCVHKKWSSRVFGEGCMPERLDQELLRTREGREAFPGFVLQRGYNEFPKNSSNSIYFNDKTKVQFVLTSTPYCMIECQTSRLVEYLLKFDTNAKDFLSLVFTWARLNFVRFSLLLLPNTRFVFGVPSHTTLIWLVIFFLCRAGILPTPREIQSKDHEPLFYHDGFMKYDIGFYEDDSVLEEWKSKHSTNSTPEDRFRSVLVLAKGFFQFVAETFSECNRWVINTNNAEIHESYEYFKVRERMKTTLLPEEVELLRTCLSEEDGSEKQICRVYMVHPLLPTGKFSFASENLKDVSDKSRRTLENLRRLLEDEKDNGVWDMERALIVTVW